MEQNNELQVVEEQDTEVSVVEDDNKKSGLGTGAGIVLGLAVSYGVYKAYKGIKKYIRKMKAEHEELVEALEDETEEE